jgi:hypothetical protein
LEHVIEAAVLAPARRWLFSRKNLDGRALYHGHKKISPTGTIFQIQRWSLRDGEGISSTVFMKGCRLRRRMPRPRLNVWKN